MRILILGALEKEVSVLNELIKAEKRPDFFYKKMDKNEIFTAITGVGTLNALTKTYSLIDIIHPVIVINIGTAGGHTLDINDGDIVVCDEAVYHGGYIVDNNPASSWNTIEETELTIKGSEELSSLLEQVHTGDIRHGKTLSGDFFTRDINVINALRNKYHHLCEDMETIAIYKACEEKKTPCIAYRIISNNELRGTLYDDNVLKINKKLQTIIVDLLNFLDSH